MIVIKWNGKSRVFTGWREWALVAAALAVFWLGLALIVVAFAGVALTIGILLMLAVPAAIVVAAASAMMRR